MKTYTKNFNMRTNESELKTWKKRAKETNKDLSTYVRDLLKEDIKKSVEEEK